MASRIAQLYYHYYIRTSDRKYLDEATSFYDAIQERSYFSASINKGVEPDFLKRLERNVCQRHAVACLLQAHFEKAIALTKTEKGLNSLAHKCAETISLDTIPSTLKTSITHVVIITGKEISVQSVWLQLVIDRSSTDTNNHAPTKTIMQAPAFAMALSIISSALIKNRNVLVWVEAPELLKAENLGSFQSHPEACPIIMYFGGEIILNYKKSDRLVEFIKSNIP